MTIHSSHPFRDPVEDPVRQLRARLGGAVTLWTAGAEASRAGLTVSSVMVAAGETGRVVALVDPDSDLRTTMGATGRGVVHLLGWEHRPLADAFAGQVPAPGGAFTLGEWVDTAYGPRLRTALSSADVEVESTSQVGWSDLVVATIVSVRLGPDDAPLEHRRGRYSRGGSRQEP